jgi:hypothetical protein
MIPFQLSKPTNDKNRENPLHHVKVYAILRLGIPVEKQASRLAERAARDRR